MAAQSAGAEVLPDTEDQGTPEPGAVNENGLTVEEQAEFDSMKPGDPAPAGDAAPAEGDEGGEEGDADGETGDDTGGEQPPAALLAKEKTPAELAADAAAGKKPPPKTVNYSKYQRELKKANDVAAAATETARKEREDRIKLAARVDLINEALQQREAAPVVPDPNAPPENPFDEADIDPNVNFAEAIAQINRRQRFQNENQQAVVEDVTATREDQQLKDTFTRDFAAYAATEEGKFLPQAYQHLKDARLTQICLAEFGKDPNDTNEEFTPQEVQRMVQMFNTEEKWLVGQAIKNRRSPAQAVMRMAKTFGFDPAKFVRAPAAPAAARPGANGQRPAPAPGARMPAVVPPAPTAQQQLETLRQNQDDARSLSDGGGAPPGGLTAELLLKLSDAEFAEMIDGMSDYQLDTLMGKVPT